MLNIFQHFLLQDDDPLGTNHITRHREEEDEEREGKETTKPGLKSFNHLTVKHFVSNKFHFLFHNSHDKFDRQIIVSNQVNQIES